MVATYLHSQLGALLLQFLFQRRGQLSLCWNLLDISVPSAVNVGLCLQILCSRLCCNILTCRLGGTLIHYLCWVSLNYNAMLVVVLHIVTYCALLLCFCTFLTIWEWILMKNMKQCFLNTFYWYKSWNLLPLADWCQNTFLYPPWIHSYIQALTILLFYCWWTTPYKGYLCLAYQTFSIMTQHTFLITLMMLCAQYSVPTNTYAVLSGVQFHPAGLSSLPTPVWRETSM